MQRQSSGGGIQAAAGGVGGDGNTAVGAMTGPAAAAGLSRASVSSTRTQVIRHELNRRQWYVTCTDVYVWLLEYTMLL